MQKKYFMILTSCYMSLVSMEQQRFIPKLKQGSPAIISSKRATISVPNAQQQSSLLPYAPLADENQQVMCSTPSSNGPRASWKPSKQQRHTIAAFNHVVKSDADRLLKEALNPSPSISPEDQSVVDELGLMISQRGANNTSQLSPVAKEALVLLTDQCKNSQMERRSMRLFSKAIHFKPEKTRNSSANLAKLKEKEREAQEVHDIRTMLNARIATEPRTPEEGRILAEFKIREEAKIRFLQYAQEGKWSEMHKIINKGINIHTTRNAHGNTALHLAALHNREEIVKKLLILGMQPTSRNNAGATPLDLIPKEAQNADSIKSLLHTGAARKEDAIQSLFTLVKTHVTTDQIDKIRNVLSRYSPNIVDENNNSLLAHAAGLNAFNAVKFLIEEFQVYINTMNKQGQTALDLAQQQDIKIYLKAQGALTGEQVKQRNNLIELAKKGDWQQMSELLTKTDRTVLNSPDEEGNTALAHAVARNHESCAKILVETYKAEVNTINACGRTPFDIAFENKSRTIEELLYSHKAVKYWHNRERIASPLEKAVLEHARKGNANKLRELVEMGADINGIRDERGHSPLALAAQGNHFYAVDLLLTLKADPNAVNDAGLSVIDLVVAANACDAILTALYSAHALSGRDLYVLNLLFNYASSNRVYTGRELNIKRIFSDWEGPIDVPITLEALLNYVQKKLQEDQFWPDFLRLTDSRGFSLLTTAVEHCQEAHVRLLLETFKMDPNHIDNEKKTPLDRAVTKGITRLLEENYAFTFVQLALRFKLLRCASHGFVDEFRKELIELNKEGISLHKFMNAPDAQGKIPLVLAAQFGQFKMVRFIVEETCADIKTQGPAAVIAASEKQSNDAVMNYLEEKIRAVMPAYRREPIVSKAPQAPSVQVGVPSTNTSQNGNQKFLRNQVPHERDDQEGYSDKASSKPQKPAKTEDPKLLMRLAEEGDSKKLESHIIRVKKNGSDLVSYLNNTRDSVSSGETALSMAVLRKNVECVEILLSFKANPNTINTQGQSPLDHAEYNDHAELLRILKETRARTGRAIRAMYLVWEAAQRGNVESVKGIFQQDMIPCDFRDEEGNSLLIATIKSGHIELARCLMREYNLTWLNQKQANLVMAGLAQEGMLPMLRYLIEEANSPTI